LYGKIKLNFYEEKYPKAAGNRPSIFKKACLNTENTFEKGGFIL
jgi:hypothetical protein